MDPDEPLFTSMEVEELDYGPSWGLIIFIVAMGFVAALTILLAI